MSKFQRTFKMEVQGRSGRTYTITDPLTVVLDINRRAYGSLNTATFMVYNLAQETRSDIQYDNAIDAEPRPFRFNAGYQSEGYQPLVFYGDLQRALSYREGPNVVTEIQVLDGGIAAQYVQVERTRNYPWKPEAELRSLVDLMKPHGVTLGSLGSIAAGMTATRGVTWIGSVWDVLRKIAAAQGGYACIDHGKVYLMAQNDALVIPGALPQLDASTGLIDTPRRSGWVVDAQMIFETRVQLLQELKVVSSVNANINGTYCVQSISHRGIISGARDGGVITALSLQTLPESMNLINPYNNASLGGTVTA